MWNSSHDLFVDRFVGDFESKVNFSVQLHAGHRVTSFSCRASFSSSNSTSSVVGCGWLQGRGISSGVGGRFAAHKWQTHSENI